MTSTANPNLRRERWKLTARLVRALEAPMLFLSAVWTVLLIVEFTRGLSPWLQLASDLIWVAFVAQFGIEFLAAPDKRVYLRRREFVAAAAGGL